MHNPNGTVRGEPQATAHAFNDEDAPNPRAVVGHNSSVVERAERDLVAHNRPSFDQVVTQVLRSGLVLAQRDALARAILDPSLSHRHRVVLVEIIRCTNNTTGTAFPGRKLLAERTGYSEAGVAKTIHELSDFGYVVDERRAGPNGGRALTHYAILKPTREDLEAAITAHMAALRRPPRTEADVTSGGNVIPIGHVIPVGHVTPGRNVSRPDVTPVVEADVTPVVPTVTREGTRSEVSEVLGHVRDDDRALSGANAPSPTIKEHHSSVAESSGDSRDAAATSGSNSRRGTRLPDGWYLPLAWGEWAFETFNVSAAQVRIEADRFRDHWCAKSGRDAAKVDWQATWRNWCRRAGWRLRPTAIPPDLLGGAHDTDIHFVDGHIELLNGTRSRWLAEFGGDAKDLELALISLSPRVDPALPLKAQVESELARRVLDRRDSDKRYQSAAKANARAEGRRSALSAEEVLEETRRRIRTISEG